MLGLVGRLLLCSVFLLSGVGKIMEQANGIPDQTNYLKSHLSFECPDEYLVYLVLLAAIAEIVGSLLLLLNNRSGAWILLAFLVVTTGLMHNFWDMTGPSYLVELVHFLKNLSIAGGLLVTLSHAPKYKRE
mmetsp:Transcript_12927/g.32985  ORF Transcript_12927/g.32985 Transcript_12927/m.32985 type:complete len:131 (+) Transcript_12927:118-510(+)|eukprot:CAMPEP_0174241856 /NCGR_PEP_ID=MMETSP0417-20130205/25230_1 /TAXON_ID=242541 /ORGANISM="Mayorella sp, Strain BSH-02190019" /LENGTH=130 /DNA_ID=CAMNT_0015321171 /DNA_START=115 /DNA_END=507 /DNA_ORIENTATION=+